MTEEAPIIGVQWGRGFVGDQIRNTATVTVLCPHCERHHIHGAMLGHRVAHCSVGRGGCYDIVLSDIYTPPKVYEEATAALRYMQGLRFAGL